MQPNIRASLVSGLLGKNKSCSKVQAQLKTIAANMKCNTAPGSAAWAKVWETFPKRNRDVYDQNLRKDEAASVILAQSTLVSSAHELETQRTGAFAAMDEVKSSLECMLATQACPDEDGLDYFLRIEGEQQDALYTQLQLEADAEFDYQCALADELYGHGVDVPFISHAADVIARESTAESSMVKVPTMSLTEALGMNGIKNAVLHTAAMRRGTFLEDDALGEELFDTKRRGRLSLGTFNLTGECDGIIAAEKRVVEVKNLMYGLHHPPSEKHYIQLEVYMRIMGMPRGQIRRQCEGKQHRKNVDRDDALWKEITTGLDELVKEWQYRLEHGKAPLKPRAKRTVPRAIAAKPRAKKIKNMKVQHGGPDNT